MNAQREFVTKSVDMSSFQLNYCPELTERFKAIVKQAAANPDFKFEAVEATVLSYDFLSRFEGEQQQALEFMDNNDDRDINSQASFHGEIEPTQRITVDEAATIIQTNFRSHQDRENLKYIAKKGPFILRKFERYDGSYITMAARQNEDRILQSVQVIIHNEHSK